MFSEPHPHPLPTCPRCESTSIKRPRFTWWGGVLGAHLLSHAICQLCRFGFNAKTGKSNRLLICGYLAVMAVVTMLLGWSG